MKKAIRSSTTKLKDIFKDNQIVIFLIIVIILGAVNPALGSSKNAVSGRPAGSLDISDMENINLFTGSLNFSIPYFEVSGRGGFNLPLNTGVQNLWYGEEYYTTIDCDSNGENCNTIRTLSVQNKGSGGALGIRRVNNNQFEELTLFTYVGNSFTTLVFSTPDGTEHVLYDDLTKGKPYRGTWYTYPSQTPGFSRGNIFRSQDGSDITFIADAAVVDAAPRSLVPTPVSGTVMTKDGTRYKIVRSRINSVKDRNGNITQFEFEPNPTFPIEPGRTKKIINSNGNEVEFIYGLPVNSPPDNPPSQYFDTIKYKGTGGVSREVKIHRANLRYALRPAINGYPGNTIKTVRQLFPEGGSELSDYTFDPIVTTKVEFPGNKIYELQYNSFGELSLVKLPTGAKITYEYQSGFFPGFSPGEGGLMGTGEVNRRVIERRLYNENDNLTQLTKYDNQTYLNRQYKGFTEVETFAPVGNQQLARLSKTKHYYYGDPIRIIDDSQLATYEHKLFIKWDRGKEYKTEYFDADGTTLLKKVETTWQQKNNSQVSWWTTATGFNQPENDPRIISTKTTLADSNQTALETYKYDAYNNLTDTYEYDFTNNGTQGSLLSHTHTDYKTDSIYISTDGAYLRALPIQIWTAGPAPTQNLEPRPTVDPNPTESPEPTETPTPSPTPSQEYIYSRTKFEYDHYNQAPNSPDSNHEDLLQRDYVVGHDSSNYNQNKYYRGNVTKVTTYSDAQNQTGEVNTYSQFDVLGNLVKTKDPNGKASTISYDDNFGLPDNDVRNNISPVELNPTVDRPNALKTFAFPTSVTNRWTTYVQFDYYSGMQVNVEDINGMISKTIYNDPSERPTQSVTAINTPEETQITTNYIDSERRIETKSDLNTFNDKLLKSEITYDGFGKTIESKRYESDGSFIVTKSIPFTAVQDPETQIWRAATQVSNPYRSSSTEQPIWTTNLIDSLGRGVKVIMQDGSYVKTEYNGSTVTVIDQAGKKRRSVTNALGQLKRVDEPNDAGQLDINGIPVQPTTYDYDPISNLKQVQQTGSTLQQCGNATPPCSQTRKFLYDSLSRLKQVTSPESGTINYTYDNNGNLKEKIDSRNVVTTYNYDDLNRLLSRNYAAPQNLPNYQVTPEVIYTYDDANTDNSRGRLTKITNGFSTTEYTQFDILGRIKKSKQTTDNNAYNEMLYKYNVSGILIEETYPSTRIVKHTLDADGDLAQIESTKTANGSFKVYANNFIYTADGSVNSMRLGNGRWESTKYNSRLQPIQIALGTSKGINNQLKLDYTYNTPDTADNNGNVTSQTITVQAVGTHPGFTANQTYTYDSLNRIKDAKEKIDTTQTWKQTFSYDRFGNRTFDELNTTTINKDCFNPGNQAIVCTNDIALINPTVNTSSNQLNGYSFDDAGNTTIDAKNWKYTYDGENRQTKVETLDPNNPNNVLGTRGIYYYDGDGKRVKKYVPSTGETTIFIYNTSGKVVAEYSTLPPQTSEVNYLTNDNLGSPRINTDQNGVIIARHDYQPFGEEISPSQRGISLGYNSDEIRKKFTGYERDDETELDFAQARMYSNNAGRFTSADPIKISDNRLFDPQQLNLYAYARNNPLTIIDPDGRDIIRLGRSEKLINRDIDATKKALEGKINDKTKEKLEHKLATLQTELIANQTIAKWIAAGKSVGELKGTMLSNFYITTTYVADMLKLDMAYVKKNFPKATKQQIEDLRAKSIAQSTALLEGGARAITVYNKIFILTEVGSFQNATKSSVNLPGFGTVNQSDYNIEGAGYLGHEKYHLKFGIKEPPAYNEELRILNKFTPDMIGNKAYIESRKKYVKEQAGPQP